jgi:hypothetical protein
VLQAGVMVGMLWLLLLLRMGLWMMLHLPCNQFAHKSCQLLQLRCREASGGLSWC